MRFLKTLFVWVLLVAWIIFILLLGLWGVVQFDLSKGWFIALVSIALVSPVIIVLHLTRGGHSGGGD